MITLIFFSSMSLIVGWYAHIFWQADQLNAEQHPLAVVGRTAPFLSTLSKACPHWDMAFELQRKIQRDYCLRHFTGEPPRPELTKGQLRGPNGESGSGPLMDFMIYKSADVISNAIQGGQSWELTLCNRLVRALELVAARRGLSKNDRKQLTFLDIGGNMGIHTMYMQAAGFSVVAFEPFPPNEDIIRSNLCMNDAAQERVTLFTKGLGAVATVCKEYSSPTYNQGNGVVSCDGSIPKHDDGPVTLKGQMEIVPLDDIWRCTKKDLDREDETNGNESNESDGVNRAPQLPRVTIGAMKMDVEGFESEVVAGAMHFLTESKIPFIVMELGRMLPAKRREVLAFFYALGYDVGVEGFDLNLSRPDDLPNVEDAYFVLEESRWELV